MLWCSHNTEGQILVCQDSSLGVEINTRLENKDLTSGFLDVFMALRCTILSLLYLFIFIKLKTSHLFRFIWPVRHGTIDMEQ
jgi:hypothetical protein